IAANLGLRRYAKAQIDAGADVNAQDDEGSTPLILAVVGNHSEAAEELLKAGADIDAADHEGSTALTHAAFRGYVKSLGMLVSRHANVDPLRGPQKLTPLMGAASAGNIEVAKLLLAAGADPAKKSSDGHTARQLAESGGFRRVAALLDEAEHAPR